MESFGDRLRQERERRGIPLEEVARAAKVSPHLLEALERDDLASLPGGPFNKGFVRAYARFIGLDPETTVAAYARVEETQGLRTPDADKELRREGSRRVELRTEGDRRVLVLEWSLVRSGALLALVLIVFGLAGWFLRPVRRAEGRSAAQAQAPSPSPAGSESSATPQVEAPPSPTAVIPKVEHAENPSRLSVPESGVGRKIADRRLVGEDTTFEEGATVWFWMRIEGGGPADLVRHVWMRGDRRVATYDMTVEGPHWRSWSRKTLAAGSTGPWSVEARDAAGRVLARAEFVCVPSGRGGTRESRTD